MKIHTIAIVLLVGAGLVGCTRNSRDQHTGESNDKKTIELQDLNGQPIHLDQYRGKVVFLNFWATWCKPCVEEMPSIATAKTKFSESDIVFLFASEEDVKRIHSFEAKNNLKLTYAQLTNSEELNIQVLPTTYIINRRGEIAFSEAGYREWSNRENTQLITSIINDHE